jgi:hypothetical protein
LNLAFYLTRIHSCVFLSLTHTHTHTHTHTLHIYRKSWQAGRLIYVLQSMYACVAKRLSKCRCTRSHTIIAAMRRESCVHESRIQQQRAHCACSSLQISSSPQVQNHRLRNAITLLSDLMSGAAFCALFLVVMHTNETMPHLHARFAQAAINLAIKLGSEYKTQVLFALKVQYRGQHFRLQFSNKTVLANILFGGEPRLIKASHRGKNCGQCQEQRWLAILYAHLTKTLSRSVMCMRKSKLHSNDSCCHRQCLVHAGCPIEQRA